MMLHVICYVLIIRSFSGTTELTQSYLGLITISLIKKSKLKTRKIIFTLPANGGANSD